MSSLKGPHQIELRNVVRSDLPIFFAQQRDREGNRLAAFTSRDPDDQAAFDAHWDRILKDPLNVVRTIVVNRWIGGYIVAFDYKGEMDIGYWIGRDYWGQGVATQGLREFLKIFPNRPIWGRAARDNIGSIRVLEKCGFVKAGREISYAAARKEEIEEAILVLR